MATNVDVLESIGPLSLVFERNMLLAHEMIPAIDLSITNLEEFCIETIDDAIKSYLRKFMIKDENNIVTVVASYPKADHEGRKLLNQEFIETEINSFTEVSHEVIDSALSLHGEVIYILVTLIEERFSSITNEVFQST